MCAHGEILWTSFQNSLKETSIIALPEVLCIHLKRFRFDAYISTKISRRISFPLTGLDLKAFMKQEPQKDTHKNHVYDLNAVITHYGGAGGIYGGVVKGVEQGVWSRSTEPMY